MTPGTPPETTGKENDPDGTKEFNSFDDLVALLLSVPNEKFRQQLADFRKPSTPKVTSKQPCETEDEALPRIAPD
jgi:hypothetical protein